MGQTIDYNQIAEEYVQTRTAAPWIVTWLAEQIRELPAGSTIIELGCGTGNHIRALAAQFPQFQYEGFDQSSGMLREAQLQPSKVVFRQGDAQVYWPYGDHVADIIYSVDVIHYIQNLPAFFREAARVLKPSGALFIATDSDDDLRNRSLTRFFPEILAHELARYPTATALHSAAAMANLQIGQPVHLKGERPITDDYIANLAAKCSSALRLIPEDALTAGVERVQQAQRNGERWQSLYTVYCYTT